MSLGPMYEIVGHSPSPGYPEVSMILCATRLMALAPSAKVTGFHPALGVDDTGTKIQGRVGSCSALLSMMSVVTLRP